VIVPDPAVAALKGARSVLIATHSPMDGDGIGSGLALMAGLRALGKQVAFVTEGHVPGVFSFLRGCEEIVRLRESDPVPACDLLLGLDAGEGKRLGRAYTARAEEVAVLNVDHHVSNDGFGDFNWVEPAAAATGEMAYPLLSALDAPVDAESALALLVALVTDTGRFCYSNTTANTLETAAALVRHGADPDRLQRKLYGSIPIAALRLQARAIEKLRFTADGLVSILVVDHDFGEDLGVDEEALKDLVDLVNTVDGTLVGALVRGLPDGTAKVSLRSKRDEADVAALAQKLGGGGHIRAAGYSSRQGPEATAERLLPELERLAVGAAG